jgi:hypothetical protein
MSVVDKKISLCRIYVPFFEPAVALSRLPTSKMSRRFPDPARSMAKELASLTKFFSSKYYGVIGFSSPKQTHNQVSVQRQTTLGTKS